MINEVEREWLDCLVGVDNHHEHGVDSAVTCAASRCLCVLSPLSKLDPESSATAYSLMPLDLDKEGIMVRVK